MANDVSSVDLETLKDALSKISHTLDESAHDSGSPNQETPRKAWSAFIGSLLAPNQEFKRWRDLPPELQANICESLPIGSLSDASKAHRTLKEWAQNSLPRQIILDFRNKSTVHPGNPLSAARDQEDNIKQVRDRILDVTVLLPLDATSRESRCTEIADQFSKSMGDRKLRNLYVLSANKGDELHVELGSIVRLVDALPCETLIVQDDIAGEPILLSGTLHDVIDDDQGMDALLLPVNNLVSVGLRTSSGSWQGIQTEKSHSIIITDPHGTVSWILSLYGSEEDGVVWVGRSEALTTDPSRPTKLYSLAVQVVRLRNDDDEYVDGDEDKPYVFMDVPAGKVMDVENTSKEMGQVLDYVREMEAEVKSRNVVSDVSTILTAESLE